MDDNIYILITGILKPEYIDLLLESYKCIPNKILSTWENTPSEYIDLFKMNNFEVVLNSLNIETSEPQYILKINGLNYIKSLGTNLSDTDLNSEHIHMRDNGTDSIFYRYKYCLCTRTDIFSSDFLKYIRFTNNLYKEKLTVICGIVTHSAYIFDIIVSGSINELLKFYKVKQLTDKRFPEQFLLETYLNKDNISLEDIKHNFYFSLDICREKNIEFIWYRNEGWINDFRSIPFMKVIQEYCTDTFIRL